MTLPRSPRAPTPFVMPPPPVWVGPRTIWHRCADHLIGLAVPPVGGPVPPLGTSVDDSIAAALLLPARVRHQAIAEELGKQPRIDAVIVRNGVCDAWPTVFATPADWNDLGRIEAPLADRIAFARWFSRAVAWDVQRWGVTRTDPSDRPPHRAAGGGAFRDGHVISNLIFATTPLAFAEPPTQNAIGLVPQSLWYRVHAAAACTSVEREEQGAIAAAVAVGLLVPEGNRPAALFYPSANVQLRALVEVVAAAGRGEAGFDEALDHPMGPLVKRHIAGLAPLLQPPLLEALNAAQALWDRAVLRRETDLRGAAVPRKM